MSVSKGNGTKKPVNARPSEKEEKISERNSASSMSEEKAEIASITEMVVPKENKIELSKNNIKNFLDGNKTFDEVIDDYAQLYADKVNANVVWSWNKSFPSSKKVKLTDTMRNAIKNRAIENGLIKRVEVKNINGLRIADFRGAGVVEKTIDLPKELWLESDDVQFAYLNKVIGGQKAGYTWHHSEIPGKMELVPFGIHNVYNHNGGRTKGQWADAPR